MDVVYPLPMPHIDRIAQMWSASPHSGHFVTFPHGACELTRLPCDFKVSQLKGTPSRQNQAFQLQV